VEFFNKGGVIMKKHVVLSVCLIVVFGLCLQAMADARRGFIGDTGSGWSTTSKVTAYASGNLYGRDPINMVDGGGISTDGLTHNGGVFPVSWGGNGGMWISGSSPAPYPWITANTQWVRFDFDQVYNLGQMWIWNWNDNSYPQQGMKQVRIITSTTDTQAGYLAGDANPVFDGIIPMANATSADPVNKVIDFGGIAARYVLMYVPTSAGTDENWSNGVYPGNVGLSEVRFYPVPANCAAAIAAGLGLVGDLNSDCRVNFADFALLAQSWMRCMDPQNSNCL
jgi:hypothetical protein